MIESRLAKVLGLEEDVEYTVKGHDAIYRIHNGRRERKNHDGTWYTCGFEDELIELINDPSLIIRKPRFNDEEMIFLRLLYKYGKLEQLHITKDGHAGVTIAGAYGLGINIANHLLRPGESVDLNDLFGGDA